MIGKSEKTGSRLVALLVGLALAVVVGAGCAGDLPTSPQPLLTENDCYLVDGQWHCPHK